MIIQSCFDIKVIVNELSCLVNSRIEKFYNTPEGELLIKGYSAVKGKYTLRALRGECIHLTDFKREVADAPSGFTMLMRKYLNNSMITEIFQPYFERIVIIKIKRGDEEYNIIIELFNKGNIIICDKSMKIIGYLKTLKVNDKVLRNGDSYDFSKPVFLESFLDKLEFKRIIKLSELDSIVKTVAIKLGVGGRYAEETCFNAGIEYSKEPGILSNDEIDKLFKSFSTIYMEVKHYKNISPSVYLKNDEVINFSPIDFNSIADSFKKTFESFNHACDYYYSHAQIGANESDNRGVFDSRIMQLKKRLNQQEDYLKELESESGKLASVGKIIFENSSLINAVLSKIRNAKTSRRWDEILEIIGSEKNKGIYEASIIQEIATETGEISLKINGTVFSASINDEAFRLANNFFEKSKKLKGKIQGTLVSAGQTRMMIEELIEKGIEESTKVIKDLKPEKKWFEKFRWLKTSNDFLLVSGKDASQNEIVIRKISEPNDLIFHASVAGSPFGVLKDGLNADETDKLQAANFILCFSRAWRESIMSDVFSVTKEQISKSAPSGEYVSHGSFIINGHKEFYKGLKMELAIGLYENKVIAGDAELIKSRCGNYCILRPGGIAPGKVAKRLMELFDNKELSSEDFLAFIPGDSLIEVP
ncbi:MAG: ribosome rescue protein RqcH [Candidatus Nanoarchaeia archaeon]|jgi:predicted ribosome quality control (RQC) complex YloA/Tae2 family protein